MKIAPKLTRAVLIGPAILLAWAFPLASAATAARVVEQLDFSGPNQNFSASVSVDAMLQIAGHITAKAPLGISAKAKVDETFLLHEQIGAEFDSGGSARISYENLDSDTLTGVDPSNGFPGAPSKLPSFGDLRIDFLGGGSLPVEVAPLRGKFDVSILGILDIGIPVTVDFEADIDNVRFDQDTTTNFEEGQFTAFGNEMIGGFFGDLSAHITGKGSGSIDFGFFKIELGELFSFDERVRTTLSPDDPNAPSFPGFLVASQGGIATSDAPAEAQFKLEASTSEIGLTIEKTFDDQFRIFEKFSDPGIFDSPKVTEIDLTVSITNSLVRVEDITYSLVDNITAGVVAAKPLLAGDADQDLDFDQIDLVQVQTAGKYLTGLAATWGEGDWDAAPGGSQGIPPIGDRVFDQLDVITSLQTGIYLTGPFAAIGQSAESEPANVRVRCNARTGEIGVELPGEAELTSINVDSVAGIFTGAKARNLEGTFDNKDDANIFKATLGGSFGTVSFGDIAQIGLSEDVLRSDLRIDGSFEDGGNIGNVEIAYVPEPHTLTLLVMALLAIGGFQRKCGCTRVA